MPTLPVDKLRALMDMPDSIRSVSILAHVDHGRSTVTDFLTCRAGIVPDFPLSDTCYETRQRSVIIRNAGLSLYFEHDEDDGAGARPHLINLIDCPHGADFPAESSAALRISDGALMVVDCIEGCAVQTENLLRQALAERVKPCLFVNKVDRCILELQMEPEDMYGRFRKAIEDVNVIIATYNDALMGDVQVAPEKGTVAFGSGLHGWGFNLELFAKIYAAKVGVDKEKMMKRMWGDNFFNAKKKTWTNVQQPEGCDNPLPRAFCQFIMNPLNQLMRAIMNDQKERYEKMMDALGIVLKGVDKDLTGKHLMRRTMRIWINAADTLLSMICTKLPSPQQAQTYRVENLYDGPMDDEAAKAIRACNKEGPLMVYVSKMVPSWSDDLYGTSATGRFYSFGRVFSGTIFTGQKVRIQGSNYKPGSAEDLHFKPIQRTALLMGRSIEPAADVPCGNIVALAGIDKFLLKSGTLTTWEDAHNIVDVKPIVSPVVKVAVQAKDSKHLPKLMEGLRHLSKCYPSAVCTAGESGELSISGCGELAIEVFLKDMRHQYPDCEFVVSDPVVSYRETVTETWNQICVAVTPNKANRICIGAEPMSEDLCIAIEDGTIGSKDDIQKRTRVLCDKFAWDEDHASKIWCYGPESEGSNVIVDNTNGVESLSEIKEHVNQAFQWATKEGVLCEESMRGIRFNLIDAILHADDIKRGAGQIVPGTRRCCFAAELEAKPALQEPVFLVEITCPQEVVSQVHFCLSSRRGCVFEENPRQGTLSVQVKAHLPMAESLGFGPALRQATSGRAFHQAVFDHWEIMPGDCLLAGSKMQELVLAIRERKSMKVEMPKLDDYLDRLDRL